MAARRMGWRGSGVRSKEGGWKEEYSNHRLILNKTEVRLLFQINRKILNTIRFQFASTKIQNLCSQKCAIFITEEFNFKNVI